jgi:hypothetical protein
MSFFFLTFPISPIAQEKQPTWEVYFSPKGGCTEAIIKEPDKAKSTILVQAYSFSSSQSKLIPIRYLVLHIDKDS